MGRKNKKNQPGVFLTIQVKKSEIVPSIDKYNEGEVLLKGIRTNFKWKDVSALPEKKK